MAKNIKELTNINKLQIEENKKLNEKLLESFDKIQRLLLEIERLKNNNNKDSSNSSKPTGTNGFKKIMNTREKSNKKKGGQKEHEGTTLTNSQIEKMIEDGKIDEVIVVEINKKKVVM